MSTTDPDNLDIAFRALERHVDAVAFQPAVDEIITRGRRRKTTRVVIAGVVVLAALVASGYAVASPNAAPRPGEDPTAVPSATSPAPWMGSKAVRLDPSRNVPGGLLFYDKDNGPSELVTGAINPCWGKPISSQGEGSQLHVYPDESTARQTLDAVNGRIAACFGFPDAKVTSTDHPAIGDGAVAGVAPKPADGAGEHTGEPLRMVVVRVGSALATFYGYPPKTPSAVDADAKAVVGRLCVFDPRCRPRAGLPAPRTVPRDGDPVWAAVLQVADPADVWAPLGPAIAAAGQLGYHAGIVSLDCDEGARAALGTPEKNAQYAVVYFDELADAEAFAAALPGPAVRMIPVRTHCT